MAARGNVKRLIACVLTLLFVVTVRPPNAVAQDIQTKECLKLGADESLADFHTLFEGVMQEVYKQAGFCAVSISMSAKRIEQMVDTGILDGHWLRVEGYEKAFNLNMIAVPVPLLQVEATFLSLKGTDFNGEPADLKGRRVGYQSGFRWLEKSLRATGAQTVEIPYGIPIKTLLVRGRLDVFSTDSARAQAIISDFSDADIDVRVDQWQKLSFYHLLAPRHAGKIDALNAAIETGIANGAFNKIYALPGVNRISPAR